MQIFFKEFLYIIVDFFSIDGYNTYCSLILRGVAQLGRALRSGRKGRWFESSHPDQ